MAKNTGFTIVALLAAAVLFYFFTRKPAEGPPVPAPGGLPPGVSPDAAIIPYREHTIYVWEVLSPEPELAFIEWRWVVANADGLPVQSGTSLLAGLAGSAAAEAAAKAYVDSLPQPGGIGEHEFTPVSPEAERTVYKGHAIYVWEMPPGWHWVVQVGPITPVSVAEGHVDTEGLDGVAEAIALAQLWVDGQPEPGGAGGAGGFGQG